MRLVSGFAVITTGLVLFNICGCRPKPRRTPAAEATATVSTVASAAPLAIQPPNQRYFQSKSIDLEALTPIRTRAKAAFQQTLDTHAGANDSMSALARTVSEAPGSGVIAIELAKAARRAGDHNRLLRYLKIVERTTTAFPILAKSRSGNGESVFFVGIHRKAGAIKPLWRGASATIGNSFERQSRAHDFFTAGAD